VGVVRVLTPQFWWYLSRGSGIVAWAVMGATCLWGILMVTRTFRPTRPAWMLDLHRWLGALSLITTAIHLLSLIPDNYVYFGWRELLLPGGSPWRTSAITWGVLSLYLLVVVEATSLVMKRLPRRLWHTVHLLSYVSFGMATVHGALAGTDRANRIYVLAVVLLAAAVTLGLLRRVTRRPPKRTAQPSFPADEPETELSRSSR
jgi:methionine sulfoxide reductase heme-binding subunit